MQKIKCPTCGTETVLDTVCPSCGSIAKNGVAIYREPRSVLEGARRTFTVEYLVAVREIKVGRGKWHEEFIDQAVNQAARLLRVLAKGVSTCRGGQTRTKVAARLRTLLVLAIGMWLLTPPQLLVPPLSQKNLPPLVTARTWVKILKPDPQAHLIQHDFVLTCALRSPKIFGLSAVRAHFSPVKWLLKEIKVEVTKETIEIRLSGRYPLDDLQKLVDAIAEEYLERLFRDDKLKELENDMERLKPRRDKKLKKNKA